MIGPEDEYEALRERLLARLRRQPADKRSLFRIARALSRIMAAERRISPPKGEELAERFRAVFESVRDQLFPETPPPE